MYVKYFETPKADTSSDERFTNFTTCQSSQKLWGRHHPVSVRAEQGARTRHTPRDEKNKNRDTILHHCTETAISPPRDRGGGLFFKDTRQDQTTPVPRHVFTKATCTLLSLLSLLLLLCLPSDNDGRYIDVSKNI